MKFEVGTFNSCLCNHASKDNRLSHHGDDLVILADGNGLLRLAKEQSEDRKRLWSGHSCSGRADSRHVEIITDAKKPPGH